MIGQLPVFVALLLWGSWVFVVAFALGYGKGQRDIHRENIKRSISSIESTIEKMQATVDAGARPVPPDAPRLPVVTLGDLGPGDGLKAVRELLALVIAGEKPIMVIRSHGGLVTEAKALARTMEYLAASGKPVTCVVNDMAYSSAVYVFQACGTRLVTPWAMLAFHHVRSEVMVTLHPDGNPRVDRLVEDVRNEDLAFMRYVTRRSIMTPKELVRKIPRKREWFVGGPEAVRLGFADRAIGSIEEALR